MGKSREKSQGSPRLRPPNVCVYAEPVNDHQYLVGPGGGMLPTKRAELDETSGSPVVTKVDLG